MNDLIKQWAEIDEGFKKVILKARKKGMNKAVGKIKTKTKKLIKTRFPNASNTSNLYIDTMIEGVRVSKYKDSDIAGEAIAGVHVLGTKKKGSGTYRLRFFENDIDERNIKKHKRKNRTNNGYHTVKGHSVGKIKGKNFFKDAVDEEIKKAPDIIEKELNKAVDKYNK